MLASSAAARTQASNLGREHGDAASKASPYREGGGPQAVLSPSRRAARPLVARALRHAHANAGAIALAAAAAAGNVLPSPAVRQQRGPAQAGSPDASGSDEDKENQLGPHGARVAEAIANRKDDAASAAAMPPPPTYGTPARSGGLHRAGRSAGALVGTPGRGAGGAGGV